MNIEISTLQLVIISIVVVVLVYLATRFIIKYREYQTERFDMMDQIGDLLEQRENAWEQFNQHGVIIHSVAWTDMKECVTLSAANFHPIVCIREAGYAPDLYKKYADSMGVQIPKPLTLGQFIGKTCTNGIILAI